ncbi:thiolase domain-containing protein [Candidatus Micrarchaeota archaeon]|nr:thiolase domain-containing protein [Candidatus Micrarchaeota archaeon]
MRKVAIVGAGLSKFGERWDASFRDLIFEASSMALEDAKMEGSDLQAIYGGTMAPGRLIGQEHVGALIADQLGLTPIASTRVEAACASGSVALRNAYFAIASGMYDIVAVGGVEKMTEVSTEEVSFALGGAGDQEWELFLGATFPAIYALMAKRHMLDFGTTEEQMASVSVKNHKNASKNKFAQYQNEITIQDVMDSSPVASPLKLLDCSPITDGAAAVILCSEERARKFTDTPVQIIGSGQASDALALANRKSMTEIAATKEAARQALHQAKLTIKDVQVAEVHDCFSIAEILAIEDLGICKKGEGGKFTEDGHTALNSKISVNTSGGLKGCGHPVGATGVKQAVEIYWQLQGRANGRQVKGAEIGLTQNVGGSGATAVVNVYKRMD